MRRILPTYGLLVISLTSACSFGTNIWKESPTPRPTPSQAANKSDAQNQELQKQLEQIASAAKGKVGVAAVVLETGETVALNPRDHFPMQSVYKLPIGMAVMKQVDTGKIKLDQKVRVTKEDFIGRASPSPIRDKYPNGTELTVNELMAWMLLESDGTASDVLMKLADGPGAVQAYLTELKISDMIVLDTEKKAETHPLPPGGTDLISLRMNTDRQKAGHYLLPVFARATAPAAQKGKRTYVVGNESSSLKSRLMMRAGSKNQRPRGSLRLLPSVQAQGGFAIFRPPTPPRNAEPALPTSTLIPAA